MQRNLKCVAQRWLYSSIHGAYDQVRAKTDPYPIHDRLVRYGHWSRHRTSFEPEATEWLQEDGTNDALESTLETLRRRLLKYNTTVLDEGLVDGRISKEQVSARETWKRKRARETDGVDTAAERAFTPFRLQKSVWVVVAVVRAFSVVTGGLSPLELSGLIFPTRRLQIRARTSSFRPSRLAPYA
jgi:hypothetical protein